MKQAKHRTFSQLLKSRGLDRKRKTHRKLHGGNPGVSFPERSNSNSALEELQGPPFVTTSNHRWYINDKSQLAKLRSN